METFWDDPATATLAIVAVGALVFKFAEWYGSVNADRKKFDKFIEKIENKLDQILDRISKLSHETLETKSPPRLNALGLEVSKELGAPAWAKKIAPELVPQVRGKQDYEIQKLSFDRTRTSTLVDEEMEIKVEICAYERGLVKGDVLDVLAIELRDELLSIAQQSSFLMDQFLVSEPLAAHSLESGLHPSHGAERPDVMPSRVFIDVSLQVLAAHLVVNAHVPALEH